MPHHTLSIRVRFPLKSLSCSILRLCGWGGGYRATTNLANFRRIISRTVLHTVCNGRFEFLMKRRWEFFLFISFWRNDARFRNIFQIFVGHVGFHARQIQIVSIFVFSNTKYNVITNLLVRSCANIVYAVSLVAKQRRYPGIVSIERFSPRPFFHPRAIRNEFETSASRIWVTSRHLISYAVYRAHSET